MAPTDTELTALQALTSDLRARVETLERVVTILFVAITAGLLLGGLFLPFLTGDEGDDDLPLFLISAPFQALGYRDEDGSADSSSVVYGSAFLILLLVVLSALLVLFAVLERSASERVGQWATATSVFLVLGVLGLWVVVGTALSKDSAEVGPGVLLLTIGALVFAFLVLPPRVRAWWTEK